MEMLNLESLNSQLTWLILSFGCLFFIVWRFVIPNITSTLDERSSKIRTDIEKAASLRSEAEKALADYKKQIASAKSEATNIIATARNDAKEIASSQLATLEAELNKKSDTARKSIEQAKAKALEEVQDEIVEMAMLATEKILLETVDKKMASKITNDAIKNLN